MDTLVRFILPGVVFLLTLASGIWLSNSGKPWSAAPFNIHKLIALAAVVLTAIQLYKMLKSTEIQALLIALIIVAGLCVLALFATGALMSQGKGSIGLMLNTHRVAPILATLAVAVIAYLLAGK